MASGPPAGWLGKISSWKSTPMSRRLRRVLKPSPGEQPDLSTRRMSAPRFTSRSMSPHRRSNTGCPCHQQWRDGGLPVARPVWVAASEFRNSATSPTANARRQACAPCRLHRRRRPPLPGRPSPVCPAPNFAGAGGSPASGARCPTVAGAAPAAASSWMTATAARGRVVPGGGSRRTAPMAGPGGQQRQRRPHKPARHGQASAVRLCPAGSDPHRSRGGGAAGAQRPTAPRYGAAATASPPHGPARSSKRRLSPAVPDQQFTVSARLRP